MNDRKRPKPFDGADYQAYMNKTDPRMAELLYLEGCIGDVAQIIEQSQPLEGTILTERGIMDVADALVAFDVGPVVYRFGTWVVTQDGIACLVRHYPLTRARLHEREHWASHLAEQSWANLWDVVRALIVARHRGLMNEGHQSTSGGSFPS